MVGGNRSKRRWGGGRGMLSEPGQVVRVGHRHKAAQKGVCRWWWWGTQVVGATCMLPVSQGVGAN